MTHEYVRPATLEDIEWLVPRLRAEDVREVKDAIGIHPSEILPAQITESKPCNVMVADSGEIVGIYGVVPSPEIPEVGFVWMHCTDNLAKYPMQFLRRCRKQVEELQKQYRILTNVVDARNTVHIKWLKWCGFRFIALHEKYGVGKKPFYEFVRI